MCLNFRVSIIAYISKIFLKVIHTLQIGYLLPIIYFISLFIAFLGFFILLTILIYHFLI